MHLKNLSGHYLRKKEENQVVCDANLCVIRAVGTISCCPWHLQKSHTQIT